MSAATASMVHWLAAWLDASALMCGLAAAVSAALVWTWAATRPLPPSQRLRWDGAHWSLVSALSGAAAHEVVGQALPMIDLGPWMLVRFDASAVAADKPPPAQWMAFSRRQDPAAWRPLRVALYATAIGAEPVGSEPAA